MNGQFEFMNGRLCSTSVGPLAHAVTPSSVPSAGGGGYTVSPRLARPATRCECPRSCGYFPAHSTPPIFSSWPDPQRPLCSLRAYTAAPAEYSRRADRSDPFRHHIRVEPSPARVTLDLTPSGITSNHPAAQEQHHPPRSTAVHPDRAGLSVKADDSWVGVSCTS